MATYLDKLTLKPLLKKESLLLLLDFDGTVVPIVATPQKIQFSHKIKSLLLQLENTAQIKIAIISGRSLKDIKFQIGISNLVYAGNHGLEWEISGKKERLKQFSEKSLFSPELRKRLLSLQMNFPGIYIEDKTLTIAIHYRLLSAQKLPSFHYYINHILTASIKLLGLQLAQGKKVYELRRRVNWTKGDFVKILLEKYYQDKFHAIIYIGDDLTDEDVFKKLPDIIGVKVGRSKTVARYFLNNQHEVIELLHWLKQYYNI